MKKYITGLVVAAMLAVILPTFAGTVSAQTRYDDYDERPAQVYKKPGFYSRHRNLINIAIGTGAGAVIGGILGGKKWAMIGAAAGAGGSALYTYKIKPKKRGYEDPYYRGN